MSISMIAVDDEINILEDLKRINSGIGGVVMSGVFTSSLEALKYVHKNKIDVAVLDIEMPDLNGIELAQMMRNIWPNIQIIFATGYDEYALTAYHMNAMAYLLKPYGKKEVSEAVDRVKLLVEGLKGRSKNNDIKVRCFGNFDIVVRGKPLFFKYSKAKELFAVLIDARGGLVSMEQVITLLWENRVYDSRVKQLYRKAVSVMRSTLKEAGCEDICLYYRGNLAVTMEKIDCDYFEFIKGDHFSRDSFMDNYMTEYSWAEETNAMLGNLLTGINR